MTTIPNPQPLAARIETTLRPLVQRIVDTFDLAGVAVGIVKDGALVYGEGFGVRNVETREPVTTRSLFHMASVSKPFVATAIVQLMEAGKVDLDAPVAAYLPYFKLADDRYRDITIQQMLSHTGGMPDVDSDYGWHRPEYDEGALERFVRSLDSYGLLAAPGEKHEYSNMAFEVLGDLIAKVSGQTFEDYVKQNVLNPLEMRDSTFLQSDVPAALRVTPHVGAPPMVLRDAYPYHRAHAPSSTLHSNIIEMGNWAIANLQRGRLNETRILQPASYDLLWHRYVETGEVTWDEAVGLSWAFGTYKGHPTIHHGGSDPGFNTELVLLPEENAAVIVLANSYSSAVGKTTDAALDMLLGFDPETPKPPVTMMLGPTLAAEGMEAAIAQYQHLQSTQPDGYDFDPNRFLDASWGAIEIHRPEMVLPLVNLWIALHPDSSDAYEMLGWAYMNSGERDLAVSNLQWALSLNPESDQARKWLEKLDN